MPLISRTWRLPTIILVVCPRCARCSLRSAVSVHAAAIRHRRCGREGSRRRPLPAPARGTARRDKAGPGQDHTLEGPPAARRKTPVSLVYIHGFSASPKDIAPVIETLQARSAPTPFSPRLAAHGRTTPAEFATVTAQDWLDDAREALAVGRRIGSRVILIGISTGALLATMAALGTPHPISRRPWCCCRRILRSAIGGENLSPGPWRHARAPHHRAGIFIPSRQQRSCRILDHALPVARHCRAHGAAQTTRARSSRRPQDAGAHHLYRPGRGRRHPPPAAIQDRFDEIQDRPS